MTFLIALGIYFAAVLIVFFVSHRSFGLPALGLTAGAVLARLWTDDLTPIVADVGLTVDRPPLHSVVAVTLTLLPAIVVMMSAGRAGSKGHGLYGSLIFAVLAVMLTYGAFTGAIMLDSASQDFVRQLQPYGNAVITACIGLALLDTLNRSKRTAGSRNRKKGR